MDGWDGYTSCRVVVHLPPRGFFGRNLSLSVCVSRNSNSNSEIRNLYSAGESWRCVYIHKHVARLANQTAQPSQPARPGRFELEHDNARDRVRQTDPTTTKKSNEGGCRVVLSIHPIQSPYAPAVCLLLSRNLFLTLPLKSPA